MDKKKHINILIVFLSDIHCFSHCKNTVLCKNKKIQFYTN